MDRVSSMTAAEAEVWRKELMEWIGKNHPHLRDREKVWETWPTFVAMKKKYGIGKRHTGI